jgi:AraC-like DNA-binding protein
MEPVNPSRSKARALRELVATLQDYVERQPGDSPYRTPVEGLIVLRGRQQRKPTHLLHRPALCVVAQGAKWTGFGAHRLRYAAGEAMLVTLDMPGASQIAQGAADKPYLSLVIELDTAAMRETLERLGEQAVPRAPVTQGAFVLSLDTALIDCAARAVRLLETPRALPLLYPLLMREISYHLLSGPHGASIAQVLAGGERGQGLVRALRALRDHYDQPMRVEQLARLANLSPSAFHRRFKELAGQSPLQYQKTLRLLEARRMMLDGEANAQTAALRVGYESASQFHREYLRMFGAPPREDLRRLR